VAPGGVVVTTATYEPDVAAVIVSLRAQAEKIRAARLAKLGPLADDERRTLESVTARILDRFLALPAVRLTQVASTAEGATYADAVRRLFGLGEDA
jgi:glutamyl-tRNA reductase